ncbi:MAG TPA: DNA recombination protein RmuC, partial [Dehalococcoidia bacterium]|nr:DNA recombination protein RmuC [Dehalococcoidia bacterium]
PNEQIYHFIHSQDGSLMDEALRNRVVLCSPITLFAILVVMRQAVDNFAIEQTSDKIVSQMGEFKKQWDLFVGKMDVLGKRISATQGEYELLMGRRRRALERPLIRIDDIRKERGLPLPDDLLALEDEVTSGVLELNDADSADDKG